MGSGREANSLMLRELNFGRALRAARVLTRESGKEMMETERVLTVGFAPVVGAAPYAATATKGGPDDNARGQDAVSQVLEVGEIS
jgi:hypothetical protein